MDKVLVQDSNKDHLKHLQRIFEKIREVGLKLKLSKSAFFKKHLQYFGHHILGAEIYPLTEKVVSLVSLALPIDMTETRHIIGLVTYYRKFIANLSDIIRPCTNLTRKTALLFGVHYIN